ncbi:MAG TPA: NUDIX hydrolase [Nakamurella sp.]|nr:NUDIX hydrolase [Nakamurella sp.]
MRGDGNGWTWCALGHRHWGRYGAAGLLLRRLDDLDGSAAPSVLLQHRAAWTSDGGTWSLPGGARDSHESMVQAALREAHEEAGIDRLAVAVVGEWQDDHGGWSYTTVIAEVVGPLRLVPNAESAELRWVAEPDVTAFALHPGFAGSWPSLRRR